MEWEVYARHQWLSGFYMIERTDFRPDAPFPYKVFEQQGGEWVFIEQFDLLADAKEFCDEVSEK